jgi:hypothetical protein
MEPKSSPPAPEYTYLTPREERRYLLIVCMFAALAVTLFATAFAYARVTTPRLVPERAAEPATSAGVPTRITPSQGLPSALPEWCARPLTREPDPVLVRMLTRTVVHEAGLRSPADADGITFVVLDRARRRGVPALVALRDYAPSIFASRRRDSSGWKVRVQPEVPERMPEGWRSAARWAEMGEPGVRMIGERVRGLLRGTVRPVCRPHHWGAPRLRREHAGWTEVPCIVDGKPALNAYWTMPAPRRRSRP